MIQPPGPKNIIAFFKPNETGSRLSEHADLIEPLTHFHAKQALKLAAAFEVAITRKVINFSFDPDIRVEVVAEPAAKALNMLLVFPDRKPGHAVRLRGQRA